MAPVGDIEKSAYLSPLNPAAGPNKDDTRMPSQLHDSYDASSNIDYAAEDNVDSDRFSR